MSAIEHRKRVQERRNAAKAAKAVKPEDAGSTETQVETPAGDTPETLSTPTATTPTSPGVPQPQTTMTPVQLRDHATQLAQTLSQLPEDQYHASLNSLEQTNHTLYAIVCDQLKNLAAEVANSEGDGYDLNDMPAQ